jgi:hypothetical protein
MLVPAEYRGRIRSVLAVNLEQPGHEVVAVDSRGKWLFHLMACRPNDWIWMPQLLEPFIGIEFEIMDSGIVYVYFSSIGIGK